MNARVPVYAGPTCNPHADAEAWEDEQEAAAALHAEAERQAPLIVLAALQGIAKPCDWFKDIVFANRGWSADEILHEGVASDDSTADAYAELMVCPGPKSMLQLKQRMADWFGAQHAFSIYAAHMESLQ
ncbi:hypothetical protein DJFAAGMI_01304 [Comamonas sp. PE63]|uniref:Uncharacterized protein n=1 Tax=Comamonas brasiliensis TaxID=1812482 RepID=A0ABS5LQG7_9BURK|nr:hypothetical protein [Comamonas sp. PE63]MBS3018572.1 hypothetical protein [Comamonas sp. PE63]